MAKPRRRGTDFAVYLAVRILICLIQALPVGWTFGLATGLAQLVYWVDKRHRNVARENLRHAFPEKSEAEVEQIVRDCYRHFVMMIVEIALVPRKLHLENWRKYVQTQGIESIISGLLSPRPLLIVTGHFGNWEIAGFATGLLGFRTYAIARVLDNPRLEKFLKYFRQKTGQTIIAKKDDFDRLTQTMAAGGKVATVADQDAGKRGVFVPFMNRPASAHKAVALTALEFDAVIVVVGVPRVGAPLQYQIRCEEVIDPREYTTRPDAVKAITQRYHDALARMIRDYPEQYFWLHRRWKTLPRRS